MRAALRSFRFITPEIERDLERFVTLLQEWQRAHNLVAASTLADVWVRHVADSLQLLNYAPDFRRWVDLGSGAGFPGLVVAIAVKKRPGCKVTLVEANLKKAAFLRAAVRETGATADIASERIEIHSPKMAGQADVVSARALAPLADLCALAAPYLHPDSTLLLLKGKDFLHEHEAASKSWVYDMLTFPSASDPQGSVVALRNLRPRRTP